jgi:hypothetical protein
MQRSEIPSAGWLVLGAVLLSLGCSSKDPPRGSMVGAAGSESVSTGTGGLNLQFGGAGASGGATGGAAAGGTSGGSASAGAANVTTDVFSPSLDKPSHDCRTDLEDKDCVSVAGMVSGHGFDQYCADINSPMALLLSPPRWPTACEAIQQNYQVDVPVQNPGSFHVTRTPADDTVGVNVRVVINGAGGDDEASNFVSAEVAGNVTTDPMSGDAIVSGTFHATWSTPGANCRTDDGSLCFAADLNGTFRSDNNLKP